MSTKSFIESATGRIKADIVFRNGKILNVFTGEIQENSLAVKEEKILGYGDYEGETEIDLDGAYISPGLIDAHVHIESSLTTPEHFACLVLPRGTTTVIADPHEIANVAGLDGIRYMINAAEKSPLDCYFMLPSCVPATPFETSGACLFASDLESLIGNKHVLGLGEMMDYPSVIRGEQAVLDKLEMALRNVMPIDGHSPMVYGKELNAYIGAGVKTDHECSTLEEMRSRLRRGMYILIREGSTARNLKILIKGINKINLRRCVFCTDDKQAEDILKNGHINYNLKEAVRLGVDPVLAVQMATLNPAECYNLKNIGAIAPGYDADLVIFKDLKEFFVKQVYKKGRLVAENKNPLFTVNVEKDPSVFNTIKIKKIDPQVFELPLATDSVRVIQIQPNSLLTESVIRKVQRDKAGCFQINSEQDILKMAVLERYGKNHNVGLGLIENYLLKNGAIATSIGHDSHNIIVIGDNNDDMALAVNAIAEFGGGIAVVSENKLCGRLPLSVGGLMSDRPAHEVSRDLKFLLNVAQKTLNINPDLDPFMTLAFMALPVIPKLRLTDRGLFDVSSFEFVSLTI